MRDRHIQRDAVHPGRERTRVVKTAERSPRLHANFLREIASVLGVAAIHRRDLEHDLLVLRQQRLEPVPRRGHPCPHHCCLHLYSPNPALHLMIRAREKKITAGARRASARDWRRRPAYAAVLRYATRNSVAKTRSRMPAPNSRNARRPCRYSATAAHPKPIFSSAEGNIASR